jgi:hypothetical protein
MLKGIAAPPADPAADITVGSSIITGGTNGYLLYDNNGVVGERVPVMQTIGGNTSGNLTANSTQYFSNTISSFESLIRQVVAAGGTFTKFYVSLQAAPGAGQSYTFTLRVNGSDTDVTCTIADSATSASDLTHTAAITAGQSWSLKSVSSTTATPASPSWGIGFIMG